MVLALTLSASVGDGTDTLMPSQNKKPISKSPTETALPFTTLIVPVAPEPVVSMH